MRQPTQRTTAKPDFHFTNRLVARVIGCGLILLCAGFVHAGSATWDLNPGSGDWNTSTNWTPMTVPNGPADIATFGLSHTTDVSISANTEVNGITFTSTATTPYTITVSPGLRLAISGVGIVNNSGITQKFMTTSDLAGNSAQIFFLGSSTAANSTFINNGATVGFGAQGGRVQFAENSTAEKPKPPAFLCIAVSSKSESQMLLVHSGSLISSTRVYHDSLRC